MRAQALHLMPRSRAEARRGGHPRPVAPRTDEVRARDAGGPLDSAFYGCGCGYQFNAAVSTSVSCPHCGSLQAW
jgi:hypothetical protein